MTKCSDVIADQWLHEARQAQLEIDQLTEMIRDKEKRIRWLEAAAASRRCKEKVA